MEKQGLVERARAGERLQDAEYLAVFMAADLTLRDVGVILCSMAGLAYKAAGFQPAKVVVAASVHPPHDGRADIVHMEFYRQGDVGVVEGCIHRPLREA